MTALSDVMKVQIHNIDRGLMERFRALCRNENVSQNAKLKEMIQEAVERWTGEPVPKPSKEG